MQQYHDIIPFGKHELALFRDYALAKTVSTLIRILLRHARLPLPPPILLDSVKADILIAFDKYD